MAAVRRKDNKGRVLRENEHQRPNGTYDYEIFWAETTIAL